MFEKIKKYYDKGIYKDSHLKVLVEKGKNKGEVVLTPEQYTEITGKEYK